MTFRQTTSTPGEQYQAQINDLIHQNRTLEDLNKKLIDQVSDEQKRAKEAILEVQHEFALKERQMIADFEEILRSRRIFQTHLESEVVVEKKNVIEQAMITRNEKLERLRLEHKIKVVQMRTQELETAIETLEEQNTLLNAELKRTKESRHDTAKSSCKEAEFMELRKQYSTLESKYDVMDSKLQRAWLQRDNAQRKVVELQQSLIISDEYRRTNLDTAASERQNAAPKSCSSRSTPKVTKKSTPNVIEISDSDQEVQRPDVRSEAQPRVQVSKPRIRGSHNQNGLDSAIDHEGLNINRKKKRKVV